LDDVFGYDGVDAIVEGCSARDFYSIKIFFGSLHFNGSSRELSIHMIAFDSSASEARDDGHIKLRRSVDAHTQRVKISPGVK
jgi:hypothetical protein